MADDNPTLSQVPEGVNGYVVEAGFQRMLRTFGLRSAATMN